jgi:hypothetical protein
MFNLWSRYWMVCATAMLRWHLVRSKRIDGPGTVLATWVGRDGARWHTLSSPGSNIIYLQRQASRPSLARLHDATAEATGNNVIPFVTNNLRRATNY